MVTEVTGVTVFMRDEENSTTAAPRREEEKIVVFGGKGVFSSFNQTSEQKEREEDDSGVRGLSSSPSPLGCNLAVQENRDLRDSCDPAAQPKPLFVYWQDTSSVCSSCTKKAGYKVVTPQGDVLSKCPSCFEDIKRTFAGAEWREHHD